MAQDTPQALIEQAPAISDQFVTIAKEHFSVELDYSEESIERLDILVDNPALDGYSNESLTKAMGSYFGETVRRNFGGDWYFDSNDGIVLTGIGGKAVTISPFGRAHNRLFQGLTDSFASLYAALPKAIEEADALQTKE